jgi:hypothetical protein
VPGSALKPRDRLHAYNRQAHHPVDASLGARGLAMPSQSASAYHTHEMARKLM